MPPGIPCKFRSARANAARRGPLAWLLRRLQGEWPFLRARIAGRWWRWRLRRRGGYAYVPRDEGDA
jgi:hypothetical protein